MEDKLKLADDFEFYKDQTIKAGGMKYSDLARNHPDLKTRFDGYSLPIVLVETDEQEYLEDMFMRLNEAVPLNAAEKRNAIGGRMAQAIRTLGEHDFFDKKVNFKNNRYQHLDTLAKLLYLEDTLAHNRIQDTKKPYLDDLVKKLRDDPENKSKILSDKVRSTLNFMVDIFLDKDELLTSKGNIPVYYLLFHFASRSGAEKLITRNKIIEFRNDVINNRNIAETDLTKANFDLLEYDRFTIQGTNDASSIKERLKIIASYFGIEIPSFETAPLKRKK